MFLLGFLVYPANGRWYRIPFRKTKQCWVLRYVIVSEIFWNMEVVVTWRQQITAMISRCGPWTHYMYTSRSIHLVLHLCALLYILKSGANYYHAEAGSQHFMLRFSHCFQLGSTAFHDLWLNLRVFELCRFTSWCRMPLISEVVHPRSLDFANQRKVVMLPQRT